MSDGKVTVKLKPSQLQKLKTLVDKMVDTFQFKIGNLRQGKLGDDIIISFTTDENQRKTIVEKLVLNDFRVLFIDDKTQKELKRSKPVGRARTGGNTNIWENQNKTGKESGGVSVDALINQNKYIELIKIANDFRSTLEQKEKAKTGINIAVNNAIQLAINNSKKGKNATSEAIDKLIEIASDKNLKNLQKIDLIKNAGMSALELSISSPAHYEDLVELCSNSNLHYSVTIESFIMFSKLVLKQQETFEELLKVALRKINIRWINIAYDVVVNELSFEEKNLVADLISFIEAER